MTGSALPVSSVLLGALALAMVLAFVRLLRGPSLADRVVAVDLISMIGVALCGAYALAHEKAVFLDVGIVVALITFVGTVAFARYVEQRAQK
jgi:multicomponent Na+:H+ antiporter subunit F